MSPECWSELTPALSRVRSATVDEVPVAAAAQGEARWSGSARRCTRPCCGWSFGHSRAPQRRQHSKRVSQAREKRKRTERDCGRSPSRSGRAGKSALERFSASLYPALLRLVLRTQPRSGLSTLRLALFDRPEEFGDHLGPRLYAAVALAVDADSHRAGVLFLLADDEHGVSFLLLGLENPGVELVAAAIDFGADAVGTKFRDEALAIIELRFAD